MSGISGNISFQTFLDTAKLSKSGDIRLDSDTQTKLENKGTLGNMVATMLNRGDETTRDQRTQDAIKGFVTALKQEFGDTYAMMALKEQGIIGEDESILLEKFTGKDILDTVNLIAGKGGFIDKDSHFNVEMIGHDTKIQSEKFGLSEAGTKVLAQRLLDESSTVTEGGTRWVDPTQLSKLAPKIAEEIKQLEDNGTLEESQQARKTLESSLRSLVANLHESPQRILQRLDGVEQNLQKLLELDGDKDTDLGRFKLGVAIGRAVKDLTHRDFDTMMESHGRALHPTSPLRGLVVAAREVLESQRSSQQELNEAKRVIERCESLISGLGSTGEARPTTETVEGDLELLRSRENLDSKTLEKSRVAFGEKLDSLPEPETSPQFQQLKTELDKIMKQIPPQDEFYESTKYTGPIDNILEKLITSMMGGNEDEMIDEDDLRKTMGDEQFNTMRDNCIAQLRASIDLECRQNPETMSTMLRDDLNTRLMGMRTI